MEDGEFGKVVKFLCDYVVMGQKDPRNQWPIGKMRTPFLPSSMVKSAPAVI